MCVVSMHNYVCFFKQKTAYEMRISDWSSDVCSSDLPPRQVRARHRPASRLAHELARPAHRPGAAGATDVEGGVEGSPRPSRRLAAQGSSGDRKSTRLNSSH